MLSHFPDEEIKALRGQAKTELLFVWLPTSLPPQDQLPHHEVGASSPPQKSLQVTCAGPFSWDPGWWRLRVAIWGRLQGHPANQTSRLPAQWPFLCGALTQDRSVPGPLHPPTHTRARAHIHTHALLFYYLTLKQAVDFQGTQGPSALMQAHISHQELRVIWGHFFFPGDCQDLLQNAEPHLHISTRHHFACSLQPLERDWRNVSNS